MNGSRSAWTIDDKDMNSRDQHPDRQAVEYVASLLQVRRVELETLKFKRSRQLISSDEYLSCRQSLLGALTELETLLCARFAGLEKCAMTIHYD